MDGVLIISEGVHVRSAKKAFQKHSIDLKEEDVGLIVGRTSPDALRLLMKKYKLKNRATVIFERSYSKSVAVEVMFKVGSNFESKKMAGISHFLEHMLFEGTKNRKDSREIANEIEKYGGEFNAYTTGDRTAFFIKIINKKFDVVLDILSDMVANPLFEDKII